MTLIGQRSDSILLFLGVVIRVDTNNVPDTVNFTKCICQ